jgi:C4-dicarboxylate-specific signal transduction histidine kinase
MATLELRVAERTEELRRTEERYSSLFKVSNITFAEQDFSDLEPAFEGLRLQGVSDLGGHMRTHPEVRDRLFDLVRVIRVNEALATMLGFEPHRLQSELAAAIFKPGEDLILRQIEMAFEHRAHLDGQTTLLAADGRLIPVHYTVNRLKDGLQISSYFDLSEQQRIADLRTAAQAELARANRVATVGAVSASIVHELNQPIASMVIDTGMGLRCLEGPAPDLILAQKILKRVARNADRIAGIVQRTRDAIIASPDVSQSVSLKSLIIETTDLIGLELRAAGIQLKIEVGEDELSVLADPIGLQQVVFNLLANAADALREWGGPRVITISLERQDNDGRFSVSDTGPGIHPEHLAQLFQSFFTTKESGIGMGLQICRTTVEALGGEMRATNAAQGGAVFECSIPLHLAPQESV